MSRGIPFALKTGAATTDRVDSPVLPTWTEATPFTILAAFQLTAFTTGRFIAQRITSNPVNLVLSGTSEILARRSRTTTNAQQTTSNAGLVAGVRYFLGCRYDPTDSQFIRIYLGTVNTPMQELTYAAGGSNGSGAATTDTPYRWANFGGATAALQALGWRTEISAFPLSLPEMNDWRRGQTTRGCVLRWTLARNGTGCVMDESGNGYHGTITGAVPTSEYLPGMCLFPCRR